MSEPAQMLRHFGGRYCLAFANSVLWRRSATPEDLAVDYAGLLAQVARVDGLPAAERAELAATAAARPGEAAAAHAAAVELRELLFRVLSAAAARTPPAGSDLSAFNEAVAMALGRVELVADGAGAYERRFRRTADGSPALDEPAVEAVHDAAALLLDGPQLARLKQCPGPDCGWLFLDESRNRSRRWCDPALCGNRERVRSHYHRHRAAAS